jgi:hypothetical protein
MERTCNISLGRYIDKFKWLHLEKSAAASGLPKNREDRENFSLVHVRAAGCGKSLRRTF